MKQDHRSESTIQSLDRVAQALDKLSHDPNNPTPGSLEFIGMQLQESAAAQRAIASALRDIAEAIQGHE